MMKRYRFLKNVLPTLSVLTLLSGCTNFRDLSPAEFTTQEFYVKTIELETTIHKIVKAHSLCVLNSVTDLTIPKIEPTTHQARVWWEIPGFMDRATMALVTFEQRDLDKPKVIAKIYAANSLWAKKPERYVDFMKLKF